jgi:hypothetical protein
VAQIRSGLAKVLASDHSRVQFPGISTADAALLAAGQAFQFTGEPALWIPVASVISSAPATAEVDLLSDYAGAVPFDTPTAYVLSIDFTPTNGLHRLGAGDVDIRAMMTRNFDIIDPILGTGGGGGAFTKSGTASVTGLAVTKTVTPPSGSFAATYLVFATPNWNTSYWVREASKTTGQFIIDFSNPAPLGGGLLDWGVV